MKENKRYLNCKYLDAGMDGMLCSQELCKTCTEFLGGTCLYFTPKDKEKKIDKSWRAKMVENGIYKDSVSTSQKKEMIEDIAYSVTDNTTGNYPDLYNIALKEDWAKGLMYCDMDGFAINEDGNLVLLDECGNVAYCPKDRFTIVFENSVVLSKEEHYCLKKIEKAYDPFWFCSFGGCEGACKECINDCEMSIFVKERQKFYDKLNENICTFTLENKSQEYTDGYTQAIADICGRLDKTAVELGVNIKE